MRTYHAWTCAAAPVHDPDTGAILGAIDISGPLDSMHPAMVQLVSATAQLAEHQLRVRLAIADERLRVRNMPHLTSLRGQAGALVTPSGRIIAGEPYGDWPDRVELPAGADRVRLDDGRELAVEPLAEGFLLRSLQPSAAATRRSALSLRFMTDGAPTAVLNGRPIPLTLRPAELLTALALHPDGLTAERLALLALRRGRQPDHGARGDPAAARADRRRGAAHPAVPARRRGGHRLRDGAPGAAGRAAPRRRCGPAAGRCCPARTPRRSGSCATSWRPACATTCCGGDDVELLAEFAGHPLGRDDLEVHDRLVRLLPPDDARRAPAQARRTRLLAPD